MDRTKVLPAVFAAAAFAFPATASAQWASPPSATIIVNPVPPAFGNWAGYGYGRQWGPGVAGGVVAAAWGGGWGWGGDWGGCYQPVWTPWGLQYAWAC